jgi:hypothetical protein
MHEVNMEPATKQDVKDAINDLKIYINERESSWLKWVVGFQLTYFAVAIAAMFFIVEHIH